MNYLNGRVCCGMFLKERECGTAGENEAHFFFHYSLLRSHFIASIVRRVPSHLRMDWGRDTGKIEFSLTFNSILVDLSTKTIQKHPQGVILEQKGNLTHWLASKLSGVQPQKVNRGTQTFKTSSIHNFFFFLHALGQEILQRCVWWHHWNLDLSGNSPC